MQARSKRSQQAVCLLDCQAPSKVFVSGSDPELRSRYSGPRDASSPWTSTTKKDCDSVSLDEVTASLQLGICTSRVGHVAMGYSLFRGTCGYRLRLFKHEQAIQPGEEQSEGEAQIFPNLAP